MIVFLLFIGVGKRKKNKEVIWGWSPTRKEVAVLWCSQPLGHKITEAGPANRSRWGGK